MDKIKYIKQLRDDENISLHEMFNKLFENGWTDYTVETQEDLRNFICDKVQNGDFVAPLLQSIEDNTMAEYFIFDMSSYSNNQAIPIYNKDELANALL